MKTMAFDHDYFLVKQLRWLKGNVCMVLIILLFLNNCHRYNYKFI